MKGQQLLRLTLKVVSDGDTEPVKVFTRPMGDKIILGRASKSAGEVPTSDNALFMNQVLSRKHAIIAWKDHGIAIIDCKSTHGTNVTTKLGSKLPVNQYEWVPLNTGDTITLGKTVSRVEGGATQSFGPLVLEVSVQPAFSGLAFKPSVHGRAISQSRYGLSAGELLLTDEEETGLDNAPSTQTYPAPGVIAQKQADNEPVIIDSDDEDEEQDDQASSMIELRAARLQSQELEDPRVCPRSGISSLVAGERVTGSASNNARSIALPAGKTNPVALQVASSSSSIRLPDNEHKTQEGSVRAGAEQATAEEEESENQDSALFSQETSGTKIVVSSQAEQDEIPYAASPDVAESAMVERFDRPLFIEEEDDLQTDSEEESDEDNGEDEMTEESDEEDEEEVDVTSDEDDNEDDKDVEEGGEEEEMASTLCTTTNVVASEDDDEDALIIDEESEAEEDVLPTSEDVSDDSSQIFDVSGEVALSKKPSRHDSVSSDATDVEVNEKAKRPRLEEPSEKGEAVHQSSKADSITYALQVPALSKASGTSEDMDREIADLVAEQAAYLTRPINILRARKMKKPMRDASTQHPAPQMASSASQAVQESMTAVPAPVAVDEQGTSPGKKRSFEAATETALDSTSDVHSDISAIEARPKKGLPWRAMAIHTGTFSMGAVAAILALAMLPELD